MNKTYFISGHSNISESDFALLYLPLIKMAVENGSYFVVGDCGGVDTMAQMLIAAVLPKDQHNRVKVFFKGDVPQNFMSPDFTAIGNFVSHEEASVAMTFCSDEDIACLDKTKWASETAKNILRRYTPKYDFEKWATAKNKNDEFWKFIWERRNGRESIETNTGSETVNN